MAFALVSVLCLALCSCVYNEIAFGDTDSGKDTTEVTQNDGTTNTSETTATDTNGTTDNNNSNNTTDSNPAETQKPTGNNNNEWTNNY